MADKPLLIHIGYHKTATTWMQTQLFTPEHGFRSLANHVEIFSHVVQPHGLLFDPAPMRELIADRIGDLPEGHTAVVSSEILSGHPFYGGQMSDIYATRLKSIAPEARILVSIRAQQKILPSVYMQYLLRGGTLPYPRFFAGTDEPGFFGFRPEHFEYDRLIAFYQALFGAKNVYVLTQESLQSDMEAACAALAIFSDNSSFSGLSTTARMVSGGVSYPEHAAGILRRVNHLRSSILNPNPMLSLGHGGERLYRGVGYFARRAPFSVMFGKKKPITEHIKHHFNGHYAASNKRLSALTSYPLDLKNYDLGKTTH